jgi:hypothetical protein
MPIPSHIIVVSATLRQYINWKDEEELWGPTKYHLKRGRLLEDGTSKAVYTGRWNFTIDLRRPAPADGRPRSAHGKTSFHFALDPPGKPRPSRLSDRSTGGPGPEAKFEHYVSGNEKLIALRSHQFEAYLLDPKGAEHGLSLVPTSVRAEICISNIDSAPERRIEFWADRSKLARETGEFKLEVRRAKDDQHSWRSFLSEPDVPARLRAEIGRIVFDENAIPACQDSTARLMKIVLHSEDELRWARRLNAKCQLKKSERLIHLVRPRKALIQQRLAAELPAELGSLGRARIVAGLAKLLDELGVMYTIVVHPADHHNDARNNHIHVIFYP